MNIFIKFAMTIILLFQFHRQISKTSINIFMCVTNYKKPQLNFFENFVAN